MKRCFVMSVGVLAIGFVLAFAASARISVGDMEGVVLAANGSPVTGATVIMQTSAGERPNATRADSDGRFRFDRYEVGEYDLRASNNGRYSEWLRHIRIRPNKLTTITLRLTRDH